jgi:hypothetical protein
MSGIPPTAEKLAQPQAVSVGRLRIGSAVLGCGFGQFAGLALGGDIVYGTVKLEFVAVVDTIDCTFSIQADGGVGPWRLNGSDV